MTFSLSDRRRGEETAKKENLKFVSSWRGEKNQLLNLFGTEERGARQWGK